MDQYFTVAVYVLAGLFGLCVGSFLNVVIYRLPNGMSLAFPPSHCTKCDYTLRWYDNIPVLSYLFLGGKCRKCKEPISFRYTAVELANALLWLAAAMLFWKKSIPFAVSIALAFSVFICIFFIDLSHKLIYDRFQVILLALGAVATLFDPAFGWISHLIGGASGFLVFLLLAFLFEKLYGREALGGGDIKLAGTAGLLLGWERLLLALLIASVTASVIMLALRARHKETAESDASENEEAPRQTDEEIEEATVETNEELTEELTEESGEEEIEEDGEGFPFGPFLVSAFTLVLLFGDRVIAWYLTLLN